MEKQMGNHYTVQVLNDREFDNLPYKGISDSLGIADREKGLAFVRRTGIKELDEATLHHEIDELVNKHSNHTDEYGIRHKKGGVLRTIIPAILALIPNVGPVLAAASSAGMNQYAQSRHPEQLGKPSLGSAAMQAGTAFVGAKLGQMSPGYQAGVAGSRAASGGIIGQSLSGAKGMLLGTAPTATAAGTGGLVGAGGKMLGMGAGNLAPTGLTLNPITVTPSATYAEMLSPAQQAANQAGSAFRNVTTTFAPSSIASTAPNVLGSAVGSGIGNMISKATQIPATQAPIQTVSPASNLSNATKTATPGWLETFGKKAGELATPQNILGGTLALGSTMGKQPEFEPVDIESIRTSLLSGEGVSPLGKQARAKLSQIVSAKPGELYPTGTDAYYQSALRQTEVAYQDAQKALAKRYNLIDPNYLQNGEYQELARRLDQELASVKSNYAISEEQRRFELSRTQQYQAIQQALQVDDNTMQELLGFTGLAADQAANKYAVDVNDVNEMRKALGGLGGQLLTSDGGILAGKKK